MLHTTFNMLLGSLHYLHLWGKSSIGNSRLNMLLERLPKPQIYNVELLMVRSKWHLTYLITYHYCGVWVESEMKVTWWWWVWRWWRICIICYFESRRDFRSKKKMIVAILQIKMMVDANQWAKVRKDENMVLNSLRNRRRLHAGLCFALPRGHVTFAYIVYDHTKCVLPRCSN